jgi:hypothetical protein
MPNWETDRDPAVHCSTRLESSRPARCSATRSHCFRNGDIPIATLERPKPELPDTWAPLPVCSPGMLQKEDGLPLIVAPSGYPEAKNYWEELLEGQYEWSSMGKQLRTQGLVK